MIFINKIFKDFISEAYSLDTVLCCMLYAVYGSTYLELVSSFQELISKKAHFKSDRTKIKSDTGIQ